MSVNEVYEQAIRPLPPADRLQLATMILNDIAPASLVDESDTWTDEDLAGFSHASWKNIEQSVSGAGHAEAR